MPGSRWSGGFLDRIKDQVIQRVQDRIKQELAPQILAPPIGTQPQQDSPEAPGQEQVVPSFVQRIKEQVRKRITQLPPVQRRLLDPRTPLDDATKKYRIIYAGQNRLLVLMGYHGVLRHCEVYSYRTSPKTGKLLLYAFCRLHDEIHAFKPEKIESLVVTDITFMPRWPVEVSGT